MSVSADGARAAIAPAIAIAMAWFATGCGATSGADADAGTRAESDGGVTSSEDAGPSFGGTATSCTDATRLVYLIAKDGTLLSFAPATLAFKTVGTLRCGVDAASLPFSMSVDRGGAAWILYDSGQLATASLADASCTLTPFARDQSGFRTFGMGFSSDAREGSDETLFVVDYLGKGLARIDRKSLALAEIAPFAGDLSGKAAELAGTGDGRLFGLFRLAPSARLVELDKRTGHAISDEPLAGVLAGSDFAFSFWGGDFYFFTVDVKANPGATSRLTRYRPSDKSVTVLSEQIGFIVVGAGVSTCAPTVPIR
ncbi:MAG: hypothetical protein U0169_16500 [Polyangiaceae bacterium]